MLRQQRRLALGRTVARAQHCPRIFSTALWLVSLGFAALPVHAHAFLVPRLVTCRPASCLWYAPPRVRKDAWKPACARLTALQPTKQLLSQQIYGVQLFTRG